MARAANRSLWLLGAAMVYIVAQSVWWAVLLLRKEEVIAELETQLGRAADQSSNRTFMVLGEAGVFLLLLTGVLAFAFIAIRRDLRLAALQRNFMLAITHELRTPIASIKLQLQTLSRPGVSGTDAERLRASAIGEADRLAALTEKVLVAAAEGAGEIKLRPERMDAVSIVRDVMSRARERDAGTHAWLADLPSTMTVRSDPQAIRSIVENLLENAMKYAPANTLIGVTAHDLGAQWRLEVADQGSGILPSERDRVFERFYRSGSEETRQHAGTGLGLYIVGRLVKRLGGSIAVRGAAPHGAIFTATFPKGV